MKVLKTKKVNVAICWSGLKNTPPREFASIADVEKSGKVLENFKEVIPDFVEVLEEGEQISIDIQSGKVDPKDITAKQEAYHKKSMALEASNQTEEVSIEIEDDVFNTFFQQFERFGRNWFQKMETYLEIRANLIATNNQPKEKAKKK